MEEADQPSNPIDMGNEDVKRRKKKKKTVEADMRLVGVSETDALDRAKWRKQISRQTP